ncbi:MAG TPA: tyrosine-protein phosphatase [Bryobacteraceae bacterium]
MKFITTFAMLLSVAGLSQAAVKMDGVGNFMKVNDHVYRGAQPTEVGFQNLAKLGIKTVVDLQATGDERARDEAKWVKAAGMEYISVPMKGMATPKDKDVAKVLALLEDQTTGPVFVHCHAGADRTGGVIACYRIEHDGWTNAKAFDEAKEMGTTWIHYRIHDYIKSFHARNTQAPTQVAIGHAPVTAAATLLPAGAQ